ncbi:MAG TPA: nuclear transport factor 2 family protein [Acidimicrobiia bacterium]|nr:nuclear transport factor 2 family protein [Acidimicrobiia bacterium]
MTDDVEAIKQLKARYFRLIDTKDWDGLATVFTDDVEVDLSGEGAGVTRGATEFLSFLRSVIGDAITVHHGHTPEIELTSPRTATGIWALEDQLWWPRGGPFAHMHGFGHYHETYENTDAGWRIKSLTITRLHRLLEPPPGN